MPETPPSLVDLLRTHAAERPQAAALLSVDGGRCDYARLLEAVSEMAAALNGFGIGRGDRVAVVVPNGTSAAAAFLGVSAGATCAPLNPGYRREELEFYLDDLSAKALLVPAGETSPAVEAAEKLGVRLLRMEPTEDGLFRIEGSQPVEPTFGAGDDEALVLHTSGTTSRPKIVPLTQRNLLASAGAISRTLSLTPADCCLNVMPLFHIHGLIGALLSSIAAGATVVCTPGFNVMKFFGWLDEMKPSWYTAVPTMHQALLSRAGRNPEAVERSKLRLIRSSSAALPPQVLAELEQTFSAPVVESYGMTEAAHQMTSNLLPPGARKPGSVGVAAGPDVAVMDPAGNVLPQGEIGEVVIRGADVTAGYDKNPTANTEAFTNGWFRTGDQGRFDEDGYLFLTGRLKEIINRGGEKISPREIDEVMLDHPDIVQAVAFAMPHEKLGEEIAAAVVLAEGASSSERDIRRFVGERLADFKTPRKIVFIDEIPKGPTGKMQRIGLAKRLGLD